MVTAVPSAGLAARRHRRDPTPRRAPVRTLGAGAAVAGGVPFTGAAGVVTGVVGRGVGVVGGGVGVVGIEVLGAGAGALPAVVVSNVIEYGGTVIEPAEVAEVVVMPVAPLAHCWTVDPAAGV